MTGADLRAARRAAGLSQIVLAQRAGIGRHAVQYHEARDRLDLRGWAIGRMRKVLGTAALPDQSHQYRAHAGWGDNFTEAERAALGARIAALAEREAQRAAQRAGRELPRRSGGAGHGGGKLDRIEAASRCGRRGQMGDGCRVFPAYKLARWGLTPTLP